MTPRPILPGSTIGVVGGGQLGRMLILEARRMGYGAVVLDPDENPPAAQIADAHIRAPLTDVQAARELARRSDVVTIEWENADVAALRALEEAVLVRPSPTVLEIAQNRILEKETARRLGLETAEFRRITTLTELADAVRELGTPSLLKTTTGGYDGRGQRVIESASGAEQAFRELGGGDAELILEAWVDFSIEASVICARSAAGATESFPVVENIHRNGILDFTIVPARIPEAVQGEARRVGEVLARGLDVVGILAVELFVSRDGRVLVNEIAPRPHNSGHYTWEACSVSQFEQQLRAVCGLPLAPPVLHRPAGMANLLGDHIGTGRDLATLPEALGTPCLGLHLYGKTQSRPGRKMGHLTVLADSPTEALRLAGAARETLMRSAAAVQETEKISR